MRGKKHTRKVRNAVIKAYRKTGRVYMACRAAGVDKTCHYDWLKTDPQYAADFKDCETEVADVISDGIFDLGFVGVEEPVFHNGKRALDYARDETGALITGKDGKFVAVPASIRRVFPACALALAAAKVPGFNPRHDHRFVDGEGRDAEPVQVIVEYTNKAIPD